MKSDEPIILSHSCEAVQIPSGQRLTLAAGSRVWIAQSHGGGTTVTTERGEMIRIAEKDTDALGIELSGPLQVKPTAEAVSPGEIENQVWEQLKMCFDPEIPINIVDLGLVYHCQVSPLAEGGNRAEVRFTLTAPGCGMGEVFKEEIRNKILGIAGIKEVRMELVWSPPWDQTMISGAGKIQLGIL